MIILQMFNVYFPSYFLNETFYSEITVDLLAVGNNIEGSLLLFAQFSQW